MADIILINDQGQDQTLTGVSKLVARGASGDVEFSVGGAGGQKAQPAPEDHGGGQAHP